MQDKKYQWIILLFVLIIVATLWITDVIKPQYFQYDVPKVTQVDWFESSYLYWYIHAFSFIPVFFLSFDKRVHYYREWRYLWRGMLWIGVVFVVWDMAKTHLGVWGFNPRYITGIMIGNLPIEEIFFFISIPFACVFIYECLNYYFPKDYFYPFERKLTWLLIVLFIAIGIATWGITYTCTTYFIAGFYLLWHILYVPNGRIRSRFYLTYIITWIPFVLIDGILTGGYQAQPIILYNPEEFLGFRVTSLPLEDAIYLIPLLLANITFFENSRLAAKKLQQGD